MSKLVLLHVIYYICNLNTDNMQYKILQGDSLEQLQGLPDNSVNCCVTSPPYYGLRDYGYEKQIGLEETPEAYVQKLVEVFREVRRVLRDDGTCWVNLGDSYAGGKQGRSDAHEMASSGGIANKRPHSEMGNQKWADVKPKQRPVPVNLKPKDLIGIPWRVAFALQADGWYLRQDIIWHKPNPMPESVTDRCTKAHEYIFLLTKSARYWYDNEAVKEESIRAGDIPGGGRPATNSIEKRAAFYRPENSIKPVEPTRNRRSVWTVATKPYKGAHFAVFPPDLIRPCILAGCPVGGTVLDPFGGSGTTAQVALEEGRNALLIELNPEYITLAKKRLGGTQLPLMAKNGTHE
jgi:DNA modification methylase